jgi:hypothetical protein
MHSLQPFYWEGFHLFRPKKIFEKTLLPGWRPAGENLGGLAATAAKIFF